MAIPRSSLLLVLSLILLTTTKPAYAVAEAYVDPDDGKTVMQIVEARGYDVEEHKVTTSDSYILTMYRLPKTYTESQLNASAAPNKPAVYLIHGLLDSSFTYVCNYRITHIIEHTLGTLGARLIVRNI
ncbi:hypothetical protein PR003_g5712 [Phytophthora rubi]|uniref:Partial AB-hydrolase lipase domain-containing protein n=1 Tax=Phytophthora rubi TaxID=129364 RepID=A0A6A4FRZ4_9STRA|nr:hypothetical protein PR003_g5712 [Phytophthora rubi]